MISGQQYRFYVERLMLPHLLTILLPVGYDQSVVLAKGAAHHMQPLMHVAPMNGAVYSSNIASAAEIELFKLKQGFWKLFASGSLCGYIRYLL